MFPLFMEAMRLCRLEWCILPVPHGWLEPRFDWTGYQVKRSQSTELKYWLAMNIGLGVVCGKISDNLVAVDFTGMGAYMQWKREHPDLAKTLPTVDTGVSTMILFKTPMPEPGAWLFLPGFEGRAGTIIGQNEMAVLPPTRHRNGNQRKWIVPTGEEIPTLTPEAAGLIAQPPRLESRESLYREPKERQPDKHRYLDDSDDEDGYVPISDPKEADRFGHLFARMPQYLAGPVDAELPWIVKGFLPETYLAVIGGSSKCGKSCIVTALAMAVAKGESFLGMLTRRAAVLWVAYEESREERAQALKGFGELPDNLYITHEKLRIDDKEGIAALRWWVRETGAKLIVIDPLYAAGSGESLADGRKARDTLAGLKELCRTERCAAIVLHHITKNVSQGLTRERFAESGQILAIASMDLLMDYEEKPERGRDIALHGRGRGEFTNQTWIIRSSSAADYQLMGRGSRVEMAVVAGGQPIVDALKAAASPLSAEELAEALSSKVGPMRNRLTELARTGAIALAGKRGKTAIYSMSPTT